MLKKLLSNEFNQNAIKLMTGASLAQAIPIMISPILTRMYTPEDFGVLALFTAITVIFGSIANGRYELAIVLPEKEEDAINILALSIIIALSISIGLLIIIISFHGIILDLLDNKQIGPWLYFVPLVVCFIGIFNALNYMNTRMKTFGTVAQVRVIKSVSLAAVQLLLGMFKAGAIGLITGQIISHAFANGRLASRLLKNKLLIKRINKRDVKKQAKRYSKFPKFTMWATLSNSLSQQSTNIFISILYSASSLGYYSLVQRVLGMPAILISTSISQVFYQRASEERQKYNSAKNSYRGTFIKLFIIGVITFGSLFFVVEPLVAFVFGEDWRIAGNYAKYLIPLMFIRFLASPLTLINIIFEKQNIDLIWQVSLLGLSLIVYLLSWIFDLSIIQFFILFSTVLFIHYVIILVITFYVSGNKS